MKYNRISVLIFSVSLFFIFPISSVFAHTTIPTTPTTSCGSLDSLDLTTHVENQIDNRILGKASSTDWSLFSTRGGLSGSTWIRNTNVWTSAGSSSLDWTGISPYNTSNAYQSPATLISPRHVVMASHYAPSVGSTIVFVGSDNQVYERTLSATANISGTDILIGVLDSDVPDAVTYYSVVASSTLANVLQSYNPQTINVPIISFDKDKKAIIQSVTSLDAGTYIYHSTYATSSRASFSKDIVSGDSGNPNFIIIDNQPVILGTHYGATSFPNLGNYISGINSAMTSLGGGYQVTEYTPETCFTSYAPLNQKPQFSGSSVNYSSLAINQYNFSTTTILRTYEANHADIGQIMTFSFGSLMSNETSTDIGATNYFSLNASTGELMQTNTIRHQWGSRFTLSINVTDNATHPATSTTSHIVDIYNFAGTSTIGLDPNFISTDLNQSQGSALDYDSGGNIYVPSNQSGYRGLADAPVIVKYKPDGTFDTTYMNNEVLNSVFMPYVNSGVFTLTVDSNSKVVFGGSFTTLASTTVGHIGRLNTDGSPDTTFLTNIGSGFNGNVSRVITIGDKIIVLGNFTTFNGTSVPKLVMLNDDGTLNTAFATNVGTGPSTVVATNYSSPNALFEYSDTKFLVASQMSSFNGTTVGKLAMVNIDGTLDSSFTANLGTGVSGTSNSVPRTIGRLSDGRIIFGGSFSTFNGVSTGGLVVLNSDGTKDTSFMSNLSSGGANNIYDANVQSDGKIIVDGSFTTFNGVTYNDPILRLNSDGTIDSALTDGLGIGYNGPSTSFLSSKLFPDGRLVVSFGNFFNYNDTDPLYGLHILQTNTQIAPYDILLSPLSDSGQYDNDAITQDTTVTITGSSTAGSTVFLKDNGTTLASTTADSNGDWSFSISGLSSGEHNITSYLTFAVLNTYTSVESATTTFNVDTTAPTPTASSSHGSLVASGKYIVIPFTENLATSTITTTSDWAVTEGGSSVTVTDVNAIDDIVYLILDSSLSPQTIITVNYTGTNLKDFAGNQVASFNTGVDNDTSSVNTSVSSTSIQSAATGGGSTGNYTVYYGNSSTTTIQSTNLTNQIYGVRTNQVGATSTAVISKNEYETCTPYISSSLSRNAKNSAYEVEKLQTFLNDYEGNVLVVTGVFDAQTELAIKKFQQKYANQILYPWGIRVPTGNVFQTTRAKINAIVCAKSYGCPYLTEYHRPGESDTEIRKIKSILNLINSSANLDQSSAVYDRRTLTEILKFQTRYKDTVLKPWGLTKATGYWYKTTKKAADLLMGCSSTL